MTFKTFKQVVTFEQAQEAAKEASQKMVQQLRGSRPHGVDETHLDNILEIIVPIAEQFFLQGAGWTIHRVAEQIASNIIAAATDGEEPN